MHIKGLWKPEYIWRPASVLRRLAYRDGTVLPEHIEVRLWGGRLRVRSSDVIGRQILYFGIFDLAVTEALWRLTDPGDLAVDVGANIGYMTAVLAKRSGATGRVMAFEAHPEIFRELVANLASVEHGNRVAAHGLAVSSRSGTQYLRVPAHFSENRGIASLEPAVGAVDTISIEGIRLDDMLPKGATVGVMKIDVEGHELAVLQGAEDALRRRAVRDIIFEDHDPRSSPVTAYLEGLGYTIWRLHRRFRGLDLAPSAAMVGTGWESPNLLATVEPERARARLTARGWQCLAA